MIKLYSILPRTASHSSCCLLQCFQQCIYNLKLLYSHLINNIMFYSLILFKTKIFMYLTSETPTKIYHKVFIPKTTFPRGNQQTISVLVLITYRLYSIAKIKMILKWGLELMTFNFILQGEQQEMGDYLQSLLIDVATSIGISVLALVITSTKFLATY